MRVEKRDAGQEKRILTSMITDSGVLGRIAGRWEDGLFKSKWANLIGGWCVRHYNHYETAPQKHIEPIYERWAEKHPDEATQKLVESFLSGLSEEYSNNGTAHSPEYILDLASTHFNRVRLTRLIDSLRDHLEVGEDTKAQDEITKYSRIELGVGAGVDVLHDKAAVHAAFSHESEQLIKYPGALEAFFQHMLTRDAFVAFMAPTGVGKSFWLMDMAWRAMEQGLRAAFFSVGDMSQNQVIRRMMARAAKRPLKPTKPNDPIRWPRMLERAPGKKRAIPVFVERHFRKALDEKTAWEACRKITGDMESKDSRFRLSAHPNNSISAAGIISILDGWERHGWTADCVIIDYADLLLPPTTGKERWEKIDLTWKMLRGLSQSKHCLVVTANQGNADSLRSDQVRSHNFSGSIGVLQHVSGMVGISQTAVEKRSQVYRVGWLKAREVEFDVSRPVYVASCLAIGNPAVQSIF